MGHIIWLIIRQFAQVDNFMRLWCSRGEYGVIDNVFMLPQLMQPHNFPLSTRWPLAVIYTIVSPLIKYVHNYNPLTAYTPLGYDNQI